MTGGKERDKQLVRGRERKTGRQTGRKEEEGIKAGRDVETLISVHHVIYISLVSESPVAWGHGGRCVCVCLCLCVTALQRTSVCVFVSLCVYLLPYSLRACVSVCELTALQPTCVFVSLCA